MPEQDPLYGFDSSPSRGLYDAALRVMLGSVAFLYNHVPWLRKELRSSDGWIDYRIGIACMGGEFARTIEFRQGKVSTRAGIGPDNDVNWLFRDTRAARRLVSGIPADAYDLMIQNELVFDGDRVAATFLASLVSRLIGPVVRAKLGATRKQEQREKAKGAAGAMDAGRSREVSEAVKRRRDYRMKGEAGADPGVKHLDEPYLSAYGLDDFPRLKRIDRAQKEAMPEISAERPRLLAEWYRANGFETDRNGDPWRPVMRQALAFRHLLRNREPVIQAGNLIAGSLAPEEVPVMLYPDTEASIALWSELDSIERRLLNPHRVSRENARILKDVLPFWRKRTIRNWVLEKYDYPLSLKIDDRTAVYFNMKLNTFSHTIPNIPKVLRLGTEGIRREIDERLARADGLTAEGRDTLEAMRITLEGLEAYAGNLAAEAARQARSEPDPARKRELEELARICARVPRHPAATLHEAFNSAWIYLVGVLMENNNISLSPGRLDQCFQPYFEADLALMDGAAERKTYIERAVELAACFFLRIGHHQMALPDFANYLYSGTRTDSAVTLGGVTPDGEDAVNDMTYVFLKVTEMLVNQEPNVNARYHPDVNSDAYLKRLCEVNYITSGTPSIHNDAAVIASLERHGFDPRDVRDWGATGCVEPTLAGKHTGHTNALCLNAIAGLEMALNDGYHPLLRWQLGPHTGRISNGDFRSFEDFLEAYRRQMRFLIDQHCELNRMCGEAHAFLRPQPFLSSTIEGCVEKAMDNTVGGAKYNTSGSFNAGMADVTDSMLAIKQLVFDEGAVSFAGFKRAIDSDFAQDPALLARIRKQVPLFGSGSDEAVEMANTLTRLVFDCYQPHRNFRGGRYLTGFWSVSWHSAYGKLSGTLPSGRLRGKSFTPGLTPQPHASKSLLDNLRDVARLDPRCMDNNIAFNVKYVPSARDSREATVDTVFSYARTYFEQGGMQLQFNMVDSLTLRDAAAHPENYRDLLVRISGYNAYFIELTRELQTELIERSEFGA